MERLPAERCVYLGDTARLPYGTKSPDTVRAYALQATRLLIEEGVKLIVVACNTASGVAIETLTEALAPVPVIGVIEPGARAGVAATRNGSMIVIATEGTVRGGAYPRAIASLRDDVQVMQQPCQLFVALAEEGWIDHPASLAAAKYYLAPLFRAPNPPDTLILGCTHFPVLRGAIRGVIGTEVALVDSAETTAEAVAAILAERGLATATSTGSTPRVRFLATDSPERFARVGEIFLGMPIELASVELVDIT
jgi:glutamate racemase